MAKLINDLWEYIFDYVREISLSLSCKRLFYLLRNKIVKISCLTPNRIDDFKKNKEKYVKYIEFTYEPEYILFHNCLNLKELIIKGPITYAITLPNTLDKLCLNVAYYSDFQLINLLRNISNTKISLLGLVIEKFSPSTELVSALYKLLANTTKLKKCMLQIVCNDSILLKDFKLSESIHSFGLFYVSQFYNTEIFNLSIFKYVKVLKLNFTYSYLTNNNINELFKDVTLNNLTVFELLIGDNEINYPLPIDKLNTTKLQKLYIDCVNCENSLDPIINTIKNNTMLKTLSINLDSNHFMSLQIFNTLCKTLTGITDLSLDMRNCNITDEYSFTALSNIANVSLQLSNNKLTGPSILDFVLSQDNNVQINAIKNPISNFYKKLLLNDISINI